MSTGKERIVGKKKRNKGIRTEKKMEKTKTLGQDKKERTTMKGRRKTQTKKIVSRPD